MKSLLALFSLGLVASCSTTPTNSPAEPDATKPSAEKRVTDAAVTPLSDLNLVRTKIPPILMSAKQNPYLTPSDPTCATLLAEVQALNAALGRDLDAPHSDADPSLIERGSDEAENAAVGALRNTAEGVVPFRGWVRRLTGAERHSREVAAAIAAGGVRRAYLKGIAQARACESPPAPLRAAPR